MKKLLCCVFLAFVAASVSGQVQAYDVSIHATTSAAATTLGGSVAPVALLPAYFSKPGSFGFEAFGFVAVRGADSFGACTLDAPSATLPAVTQVFGCTARWLQPPATTVHVSMSAAIGALEDKPEAVRKGCVIVREPRTEGMSSAPQFWLTCRTGFITYECP